MREERKHIDNLFYENIEGLNDLPPARIWGGMEAALDNQQAKRDLMQARKNRNALVLLLLLIGASAGMFWMLTDDQDAIGASLAHVIESKSNPIRPEPSSFITSVKKRKPAATVLEESTATMLPMAKAVVIHHGSAPATYILNSSVNNASARPVATIQPEHFVPADLISQRGTVVSNIAPQSMPVNIFTTSGSTAAERNALTLTRQKKHKLSLTAFFAPDITTRNLEQFSVNARDEAKEEIERAERNGALDFTFGARLDYQLDKHFSLQSGISFSTNTIDIAEKTVYARFDKTGILRYCFNMSSGYSFSKLKSIPAPQFTGDSARTTGSTSTLHYINIPLVVKYSVPLNSRIDLSLQAGLVARFIAWEKISTTYDYFGFKERSISRQIEGLKKSYFNGVVGVGVDYALTKKVAITAFPSFNFATSSINRNAPVKAYPNTLSVATGVKFTF